MVFVLAGVGFVLFTQNAEEESPDNDGPTTVVVENTGKKDPKDPPKDPENTPPESSAAFAIEEVSIQPSGDENWLLELQVRYHNESSADLELISPNAQLLTSEGAEVPTFFLAFAPPPIAPAEAEEVVQLRYWLDSPQKGEDLQLKILDEQVEVALEKTDDGSVVRDRDD